MTRTVQSGAPATVTLFAAGVMDKLTCGETAQLLRRQSVRPHAASAPAAPIFAPTALFPAGVINTGGIAPSHGSATSVLVLDTFANSKPSRSPRTPPTARCRALHGERQP